MQVVEMGFYQMSVLIATGVVGVTEIPRDLLQSYLVSISGEFS